MQFIDVLFLAGLLSMVIQFLPVVGLLFDNHLLGFLLVVIAIVVFRRFYRFHMARMAKLAPSVREAREKRSREWWKETSKATFSPSEPLDLRNMTRIKSIFNRH